jgi:nicotinate-nucleotide adenylyltransferase
MVRIAISGFEKFKLCDIECKLSAPYYTADTLYFLLEKHPNYSFEIIMGSDNYLALSNHKWYNSTYILNNFKIIVYPRGEKLVESNNLVKILNADLLSFSSSNIKSSLPSHLDEAEKSHLDNGVINYIRNHNLYDIESNEWGDQK